MPETTAMTARETSAIPMGIAMEEKDLKIDLKIDAIDVNIVNDSGEIFKKSLSPGKFESTR